MYAGGATWKMNPDRTTSVSTTDALVADQVEQQLGQAASRSINENNPGVTVYSYHSWQPDLTGVPVEDQANEAIRRTTARGDTQRYGDAEFGFAEVSVGDIDLESGMLGTGSGTQAVIFDVSGGSGIAHDVDYSGMNGLIVWVHEWHEDGTFVGRVVEAETTFGFSFSRGLDSVPEGALVGCGIGLFGGLAGCLPGAGSGAVGGFVTGAFGKPTTTRIVQGPWGPR